MFMFYKSDGSTRIRGGGGGGVDDDGSSQHPL
jgi:hypothetical protein